MQKSSRGKKCWLSKTDSTRWNSTKCHTREWMSNLDVDSTSLTTMLLTTKWPQLLSWRNKQMLGNVCLLKLKKQLQLSKLSTITQTTQTLSSRRPTSKADLADSTPIWLANLLKNVLPLMQALIKRVNKFHLLTTVRRNLPLPFLHHITARSKTTHHCTQVRNKNHLSTVTHRQCHHHSGARSHQFRIPPTTARAMLFQVQNSRILALSGPFDQVASRNLAQLLSLESLRKALVE